MRDEDHVVGTRAFYDAAAAPYVQWVGTTLTDATETPVDRSLLAAFAELTAGATPSLVADVGCGPGRVAAFLAAGGLDVVGVDLSPAMVAAARAPAHPGIAFEEGRLTDLPFADGALAGAVCWYSVIHTPPERLDPVAAELARVLAPGGHVLLAFQAGEGDAVHRADAYGAGVPLTSYRHAPDDVARCLTAAGLRVHTRAVREPTLGHEVTPQAFLLARSPTGGE